MKIGIDCRMINESGIGRYLKNLLFELQKLDMENDYFLFLLDKDLKEYKFNQNFIKVKADFGWYGAAEQIKFPKLLNSYNLDLVHFPHFNVPIFYKGKFIVTIHDLIHQHFQTRTVTTKNPILFSFKKLGYKKTFSYALYNSQKILTPTNFVKDQLIKEWNIKQEKIEVTHEGVDENIIKLSKISNENSFTKVSKKFNFTKPYLFYVGNAQPHKNLTKLIDAFKKIKQRYPEYNLVLSGPNHFFWEKIKKENRSEGLIFTGFVSEEELVNLYKNSESFILPSLEEGFGIPILEAMACSTPVICSNIGVLKEVGEDAALYFDPNNIDDMADKIIKVLKDEKFKKQIVFKGNKRYKQFSWGKMAKQTLDAYLLQLSQ